MKKNNILRLNEMFNKLCGTTLNESYEDFNSDDSNAIDSTNNATPVSDNVSDEDMKKDFGISDSDWSKMTSDEIATMRKSYDNAE
jgi:hypothetical protein